MIYGDAFFFVFYFCIVPFFPLSSVDCRDVLERFCEFGSFLFKIFLSLSFPSIPPIQ